MPLSPVDSHDPTKNPFILEQSKLSRVLAQPQAAQPHATTATRKTTGETTSNADTKGMNLNTQQIISLIVRFRLRSMTFDQLKAMPLSKLNPQEKEFVLFMRKNPQVFHRIASLDGKSASLSTEDVKLAARLAGDALVLSDEDLKYLKEAPLLRPEALTEEKKRTSGPQVKLDTQDLTDTLNQLNPKGLRFEELMALRPENMGLTGRTRQALELLQSPTVSKILQKVAEPYKGMVTPEVLRILASLIWNPAIYGAMPIVFFRSAPLEHEDINPLTNVMGTDLEVAWKERKRTANRYKPSFRLEAHHIMNICHKISPDGHVSLKQLQQYKPKNKDEEKALNLLRQTKVFRALANLDHDPDSLSDDDIQLALAEGTLVLSDPYMVLVITP